DFHSEKRGSTPLGRATLSFHFVFEILQDSRLAVRRAALPYNKLVARSRLSRRLSAGRTSTILRSPK
ncbi:hypothetical protein, partial [Shinella sp. DD12]|uniref:hypothetical protein n=1 Tax=Shinella sp. DD12 TaxID=1410620 RepID=UPI001AEC4728